MNLRENGEQLRITHAGFLSTCMDFGKYSYSTLTDGGNLIIPLILQAFAATISLSHTSEESCANPSGNMSGKVKS